MVEHFVNHNNIAPGEIHFLLAQYGLLMLKENHERLNMETPESVTGSLEIVQEYVSKQLADLISSQKLLMHTEGRC